MYKTMSEVDNYCIDCVGHCIVCCEDFEPKYIDTCWRPLDGIIRTMIDEIRNEDPVDVLGEDAKDGQKIDLCKDCRKDWGRRHKRAVAAAAAAAGARKKQKKPFGGTTQPSEEKPSKKRKEGVD